MIIYVWLFYNTILLRLERIIFSLATSSLPAVKYTGANSLKNDKDILPKLPNFDLPTEEDTATAKDSVADVDANATPDIKSVEMLSSSSSSSSVSTESSNA